MNKWQGKRIYFIAIAGTGMSALAGLFKQNGCEVAGSDLACFPPVSELLERLQIEVKIGYDIDHLRNFNPDYVVIGNFVRSDNPQAQYVMREGIEYGSFPSTMENFFLQDTTNFVVVGTHGKSTTTSCLSYLLSSANLAPGYLIGAIPVNFGKSFEGGAGKYFVLEGDEYDTAFFDKESKFLHYKPTWGVWTSLEFDHADIFPSIDRIEEMFRKFMKKISPEGGLIYCRDWERVHELSNEFSGTKISYGFHPDSDWRIEALEQGPEGMKFHLRGRPFFSSMTGSYNAQNFAAALVAASRVPGLDWESLAGPLKNFLGLKRRQEVRWEKNGRRVIDDFAHHPTAVAEVIESTRHKFPKSPIVVIFEPRSNTSRRKIFQKEFTDAFSKADYVYLPEVFKKESLGEGEALDISGIVRELRSRKVRAEGPLEIDKILEMARSLSSTEPVTFLILSNGSFEGLHHKLISVLESL